MTNERVGRIVREHRRKARISQSRLADEAGLGTRHTVAAIESGRREVTAREVVTISAALNLDIEELLNPFAPPANIRWRWRLRTDVEGDARP